MLESIIDKSDSEDVDERITASDDLADICADLDSDSDSLPTAVVAAVRFAQDEAETVQFNGTKAVSKLVKPNAVVRTLAEQPPDSDSFESSLEWIVATITSNLESDRSGRVRGRAALAVGRIASARSAIVSTETVVDQLDNILESESKPIRIQRAVFALSYIGTYDAPCKDAARQLLGAHIDTILEKLVDSGQLIRQSVGVKAMGLTALSYPDAVLPGAYLQQVVESSTARAKNRNRAIRSLWQLARTYPGVVVSLQNTLIELLSYTTEDAEAAETLPKDSEQDLRKYARYIRSNAANTIATIAQSRPESIDPVLVSELVDSIADRDGSIHRAILAIGELAETYTDEIIEANGPQAIHEYLQSDLASKAKTTRHRKARGYAVWALIRLAATSQVELSVEVTTSQEYLMGVPGTEKTQFDHRRTEALNCLADRAPSSVAEESICEYLIERIASSDHDTERRQAATTLAVVTTHRSNVASVLSSDSIIQLLDDESDWDVCTRLLASLDGYDTEVSSEVLSIMESKDESLNRLWRTLSDTAFATRLLCPNCGISYSIESVFEGALCDRCGDGYLSAKGAPLDF